MTIQQGNETLYGLVDGAQYPDAISVWVLEFSPEVRSLFEGMPEEEAGDAAPILFEIDNAEAEWIRQIDEMDQYRPCFTVLRSSLTIDSLKAHLQDFLFADIGEGMVVLMRFFDPRSLPSLLDTVGEDVRSALTSPMSTWLYRGGHTEWQHVEISENFRTDAEPVAITLTQRQLDQLEQRDEPHTLISEFVGLGLLDEAQPYANRYQDFIRRYNRAVQWGLTSWQDRHAFCVASYQYDEQFDQQGFVQAAIRTSAAGKKALFEQFDQIPDQTWQQLKEANRIRASKLDEQGTRL